MQQKVNVNQEGMMNWSKKALKVAVAELGDLGPKSSPTLMTRKLLQAFKSTERVVPSGGLVGHIVATAFCHSLGFFPTENSTDLHPFSERAVPFLVFSHALSVVSKFQEAIDQAEWGGSLPSQKFKDRAANFAIDSFPWRDVSDANEIQSLGLSARAEKALKNASFNTIDATRKALRDGNLKRTKGIGPKSLKEIRTLIADYDSRHFGCR